MNSSHVRNDDIIYYAYTVKSYNAKNLETLIHDQLQDFQYKESNENSAKEWYLFPLDSIIRILDFIVEKYENINEFSETVKNEIMNSVATTHSPDNLESEENVSLTVDLIETFKEYFEITNNANDYVTSSEICEWIIEIVVNSDYCKFIKLLKQHCNSNNMRNVYNKDKKIYGRSVRVWFGIKKISI